MNFLRYKGGKAIPENVLNALKYTGKVGVITRPTWNTLFGSGNDRWKRRQLFNLVDHGVFEKHSCAHQKDTWVLTDWAKALLRKNGFSCVAPVPPHLIEHDENVGRGLWYLKEKGFSSKWITERELKGMNSSSFIIQKNSQGTKHPDAIFRPARNQDMTVAVEYERTGKSLLRYQSIVRQYSRATGINYVLYIVEDETIKKRIKAALNYNGDRSLIQRMGFISALEWNANPLRSRVEVAGKIHLLDNIFCKKSVGPHDDP